MSGKHTLIIGGARSGKSRFAQELASGSDGPVLFVATAEAGDDEMRRRIEEHKRQRPAGWSTLEAATQVGRQLEEKIGGARLVIVDCVTLLVSNLLMRYDSLPDERIDASAVEKEVTAEIDEMTGCMKRVSADFIIVSNDVGMGLVPADKLSRLYRDLLGKANQTLAECSAEVYLMVAGLPVKVKPAA